MSNYNLIQAELVAWLDAQPDEPRYHAAFGDAPYFLGSIVKRFGKPNAAPAKDYGESGVFRRTSKGFMGETWDGFDSPAAYQQWCSLWGRGLLKVLYPGAVIAICGGSRTWHRVAAGLEDSGFEVFDVVMWIYGSGFPKGKNISLAIEKLHGVTRLKRQRVKLNGQTANGSTSDSVAHKDWYNKNLAYEDDPFLEAALIWKGYNTVLKPAYEPIILARAPRQGRVVDNALDYGTGALNIDGARVPVYGGRAKIIPTGTIKSKGVYDDGIQGSYSDGETSEGRYPANVIMHHSERCRMLGYEQIEAAAGDTHRTEAGTGETRFNGMKHKVGEPKPKYDIDGLETVEHWDCAPDCPIGQLNAASGVTKSTGGKLRTATRASGYKFGEQEREIRGDIGGASRFFYTGKSATWERCAGLPERSKHPTMKPIQLTEYIARLLKPPPFPDGRPRRLLVPFAGVGSEVIGGILAGWDEIDGVELSGKYLQDAAPRCEFWKYSGTYQKAKRRYNKIQQHKPKPKPMDNQNESGGTTEQLTLF